ncbi:hypothetical protein GF324_11835, partial [bacterium]|nr:hypothetical protein [bacterium]
MTRLDIGIEKRCNTIFPLREKGDCMCRIVCCLALFCLIANFALSTNGNAGELDEAGGPDVTGYAYRDNTEPGGPAFDWIDIADSSPEIGQAHGIGGDDVIGPFAIGFDFPFYRSEYDHFYLAANGAVLFDTLAALPGQTSELPVEDYPAMIAWMWNDLDPTAAEHDCYVYLESITSGGASYTVLQFEDYASEGAGEQGFINAEVILYEDGRILVQYEEIGETFSLTTGTIGMQNAGGGYGHTVQHNNSVPDYPGDGTALEFYIAEPNATLEGTITDASTGNGLEGATVDLGFASVLSDDGGVYEIDAWAGEVVVTVQREAYAVHQESLTLEPGTHTLDIELEPQGIFSDFETLPDPWSPSPEGVWERGIAEINPDSAYSGDTIWGAPLNAWEYENNTEDYLRMQTPLYVLSDEAELSYAHWYEYETNFDGYYVLVSTNHGSSYSLLVPIGENPGTFNGFTGEQVEWETVRYRLEEYAGETIVIAFVHSTDFSVANFAGVSIDDLGATGVTALDPGLLYGPPGSVHDCDGNPLEDVRVYLPGTNRESFTNPDGSFSFVDLPAGEYDLVFSHASFWSDTLSGVFLPGDSGVVVDDVEMTDADGEPETHVYEIEVYPSHRLTGQCTIELENTGCGPLEWRTHLNVVSTGWTSGEPVSGPMQVRRNGLGESSPPPDGELDRVWDHLQHLVLGSPDLPHQTVAVLNEDYLFTIDGEEPYEFHVYHHNSSSPFHSEPLPQALRGARDMAWDPFQEHLVIGNPETGGQVYGVNPNDLDDYELLGTAPGMEQGIA